MGFIAGSVTYRKFRVMDELPKNFRERLQQGLQRYAFREIDPKKNPESSIGWVNPLDPLDPDLSLEKLLFGSFVVLGVRVDRKSIPAALLKARVSQGLREAMRERRVRKLSREEVYAVRQTVRETMLAAVPPTTALYEAVWNYEKGEVYLSTHSSRFGVEFMDLFEVTTGLALEEVTLLSRAEDIIESEGLSGDVTLLDEARFGR